MNITYSHIALPSRPTATYAIVLQQAQTVNRLSYISLDHLYCLMNWPRSETLFANQFSTLFLASDTSAFFSQLMQIVWRSSFSVKWHAFLFERRWNLYQIENPSVCMPFHYHPPKRYLPFGYFLLWTWHNFEFLYVKSWHLLLIPGNSYLQRLQIQEVKQTPRSYIQKGGASSLKIACFTSGCYRNGGIKETWRQLHMRLNESLKTVYSCCEKRTSCIAFC